jgi:hypothetical protein
MDLLDPDIDLLPVDLSELEREGYDDGYMNRPMNQAYHHTPMWREYAEGWDLGQNDRLADHFTDY